MNAIELVRTALSYFFGLLNILILARVILSWLPMAHNNQIVRFLFALTEPILAPIRKIIRKSPLGGPGMMLDFSPIIAFFLLYLLQNVLDSLLRQI
ncbi:MAG: YggT family protein [Defluviitaleaceae bacterium]|nr:YggT family protein [Defluviitaleaceae bacterium]